MPSATALGYGWTVGAHAHHHGHHDHGHDLSRAFAIGIALNLGFVVIEAIFGFYANSMALLADAGHNLSDVLGLVVAWGGGTLARRALFAEIHLRSEESVDPRRARQRACSC